MRALELDLFDLVVDDGNATRRQRFTKNIVRIGAHESNDLLIDDQTVSRFHCEIRRQGLGWLLLDLDSTNGTYVDELHVREVWLHPGCVFTLGNAAITFAPSTLQLQLEASPQTRCGALLGHSEAMRRLFDAIEHVAPTALPVTLEGQRGVGKRLIAETFHARSARADGPLVYLDCCALSQESLRVEIFGQGARPGVLERAHQGSLIISCPHRLPRALQLELLETLETGVAHRVGTPGSGRSVDVRLLTCCEPGEIVHEALFAHLSRVDLEIPPLRERPEDIPPLAHHFLGERGVDDALMAELSRYDWPGNVAELRHVLGTAATFAPEETVRLADLPADLRARLGRRNAANVVELAIAPGTGLKAAKEQMIAAFERDYLTGLLERHDLNITKVAREAGIDRRHVYRLMKKHGIVLPERPS